MLMGFMVIERWKNTTGLKKRDVKSKKALAFVFFKHMNYQNLFASCWGRSCK